MGNLEPYSAFSMFSYFLVQQGALRAGEWNLGMSQGVEPGNEARATDSCLVIILLNPEDIIFSSLISGCGQWEVPKIRLLCNNCLVPSQPLTTLLAFLVLYIRHTGGVPTGE